MVVGMIALIVMLTILWVALKSPTWVRSSSQRHRTKIVISHPRPVAPRWVEGKLTPKEREAFAPISGLIEAAELRAEREFYGDYSHPALRSGPGHYPHPVEPRHTYRYERYVPGLGIVSADTPEKLERAIKVAWENKRRASIIKFEGSVLRTQDEINEVSARLAYLNNQAIGMSILPNDAETTVKLMGNYIDGI